MLEIKPGSIVRVIEDSRQTRQYCMQDGAIVRIYRFKPMEISRDNGKTWAIAQGRLVYQGKKVAYLPKGNGVILNKIIGINSTK